MTAIHQEIIPNPEHEAQDADMSSLESSCETLQLSQTKEIFRRESSPLKDDLPPPDTPTTPKTPVSKIPSKPIIKTMVKNESPSKKESPPKKKSNSGIPLPMKSGTNTAAKCPKSGTYRHTPPAPLGPVINKNTLEVQFLNNKKRLIQLHTELLEKQRPLMDMHKSLLRTQKQLEKMGKKVFLEDLKVMSLKVDPTKTQMDGSGENPTAETAMTLKSSIDNILDQCVKVCKKCFVKRDHVVKVLEEASKMAIEPADIEAEVEGFKKEKDELEHSIDSAVKESEKKIEEVISNWQKVVLNKPVSEETTMKINELEDTVRQQQKAIQEAEDNIHSLTRKFEEKKASLEKTIIEMQEKYTKLEEDMKKEKKSANDYLMKSRTLRGKLTEQEVKAKEAEEKCNESIQKLRQIQDQMHRKEVQWCKEKEEFKKNEQLLQQKFAEKQSQFDTRLKDFEKLQKSSEVQQVNLCRNLETQIEIKDQECLFLEKQRDDLAEKTKILEDKVDHMKREIEEQQKEIEELNLKAESIPAIEYKPSESQWIEIMEYKQKIAEAQNTLEQQNDQINKMQSSLKAHAKLAAALKLEKDNAMKYSTKLREILQEARDELDFKNKTIYKIHEKLVLKEKAYEKLKMQLKEYEELSDVSGDKWAKNRCQICMSKLGEEKMESSSCVETEVGKSSVSSPQYVSESLIGMSVKKVDHLRARLNNLKKMKLPGNSGRNALNVRCSWSSESKMLSNQLRKQIELRGKLYQILQKHADQSCEDFINLLKLRVSNGGRHDELKPSNIRDIEETLKNPPRISSNSKISDSFSAFSQYLEANQFHDRFHDSVNSDTDEFV